MTLQYDASHHQQQLETEAEHERLVREVRSTGRRPSAIGRAREALGLGIVGLGLALGGESARRRTQGTTRARSVAV